MQEILLNAYLAYKANRACVFPLFAYVRCMIELALSFVFYNYTWNDNPNEDYADYAGKPIPSRVPLTALIRGELSVRTVSRSSQMYRYTPPRMTGA